MTFKAFSSLFLKNTSRSIISLQADFNNGSGLINIGIDNSITVNYTTYGKKIIKFIITYDNSTQSTNYAVFTVAQNSGSSFSPMGGTPCDRLDYITATIPFTDYDNNTFKGQGNTAYYFATNGPCNGKVKKPIIILDGFDPGDTRTIEKLYNTYLDNPSRYLFADQLRQSDKDL